MSSDLKVCSTRLKVVIKKYEPEFVRNKS